MAKMQLRSAAARWSVPAPRAPTLSPGTLVPRTFCAQDSSQSLELNLSQFKKNCRSAEGSILRNSGVRNLVSHPAESFKHNLAGIGFLSRNVAQERYGLVEIYTAIPCLPIRVIRYLQPAIDRTFVN